MKGPEQMDIIEIKDFTFSYPEAEKETLSHISMTIEEGSMNVLCGSSGCGKSSLLRQLKSVLADHGQKSGEILYYGRPLSGIDQRTQTSEIGFVLQNPDNQIVTDKVWHELAFGLESLGYDSATIRLRVAEMASYFGIQKWFMSNVSELSGGQKQLLNLASIMAMHPKLLILDEPTSQLDPIAASDFLETVRKINRDIGTTVIITEHRLQDIIPYADQVFVLDQGRLLTQGRPREIGLFLKNQEHGMFLSMPVPMQIYAGTDSQEDCPLTVSEGRRFMQKIMAGKTLADGDLSERIQLNPFRNRKKKDAYAISVSDVWFRYTREGSDIVKDLSLKVEKGSFYALVGGNGTGKSTTMSLLSGIHQPYRGKILLGGKDIRSYKDMELYRDYLGVLPQNPQSMFVKSSVREDLYAMIGGQREGRSAEYTSSMDKAEAIQGIVKLTHLEHLLDRHPYDLSGGEQQRLALAKVLLLRPRLLLMDEPTKGMDASYKCELGSLLKQLQSHGITIFMISHDVEFVAEYADEVGLFFEGNIVTSKDARSFFAGNSFYTTAANRMARQYFPEAVTVTDVVEAIRSERE